MSRIWNIRSLWNMGQKGQMQSFHCVGTDVPWCIPWRQQQLCHTFTCVMMCKWMH